MRFNPFPYKIINIGKNEHHKKNEHRDEESQHKRSDVRFENKLIECFHN